MKKYVIAYYGTSGNGLVDYNEDACISLDNAMTFDSEPEAFAYMVGLQNEWLSELRVEEVDL